MGLGENLLKAIFGMYGITKDGFRDDYIARTRDIGRPLRESEHREPRSATFHNLEVLDGAAHQKMIGFKTDRYYNVCIYRRTTKENLKWSTADGTAIFSNITYYICRDRLRLSWIDYRNGAYLFTLQGWGQKGFINETFPFYTDGRVPSGADAFIKSITEA